MLVPATVVNPPEVEEIVYRAPTREDGSRIWRLIDSCSVLDDNSMYCNLLQCDHFSDTCMLAERGDTLLGWVSGYIIPGEPDTLFVWQVAVAADARGCGVGKGLLKNLLERPACEGVSRIKTTITAANRASWGLFESFAEGLDAKVSREPYFKRGEHFDGEHATEHLVTIDMAAAASAAA